MTSQAQLAHNRSCSHLEVKSSNEKISYTDDVSLHDGTSTYKDRGYIYDKLLLSLSVIWLLCLIAPLYYGMYTQDRVTSTLEYEHRTIVQNISYGPVNTTLDSNLEVVTDNQMQSLPHVSSLWGGDRLIAPDPNDIDSSSRLISRLSKLTQASLSAVSDILHPSDMDAKSYTGYTFKDGSYYLGQWEERLMSGRGSFYYSNGDIYIGYWHNGLHNGHGLFYWASGSLYVGSWIDDEMFGYGIWSDKYGRSFKGDWVNDSKNGYGEFSWPNGDVFEGYFVRDEMHGHGKLVTLNGIVESVWVNGVMKDY